MRKAGRGVRGAGLAACVGALILAAWGAPGHRMVTRTAVALKAPEMPAWLLEEATLEKLGFQASEPDRYRGNPSPVLAHENNADHYLDAELLEKHGLTLRTLPRMRYEFVSRLVKTTPEESGERRGVVGFNPDVVGFLPYAIEEHHAKLVSSFNTVRILEKLADPKRARQLEAAKENVVHEMGQLSHFVGDASQPLHMTIHHHGWVGENPKGYTRERGFHARIDDTVVALHQIRTESLRPAPDGALVTIPPGGTWEATIALLERSYSKVEALYLLEKSGELDKEAGKVFITERLADAAATLGAFYRAAWVEALPTEKQVQDFVKYTPIENAGVGAR